MPEGRPTLGVLLTLACCSGAAVRAAAAPEASARDEIRSAVAAAMDPATDPCRDLYRYACGGWLDATERPADQARWSRGFSALGERNRSAVRELLEEAAAAPGPAGTARHHVGRFYASCLDTETIESRGATPIAPLLGRIAAIEGPSELLAVTAHLHRHGVVALFALDALPDPENAGRAVGVLSQGGLGLPDRDDYLGREPERRRIRAAYRKQIVRLFELAGFGGRSARSRADRVIAFETELARASRPRPNVDELGGLGHRLDRSGLDALAPGLPWASYFESAGRADLEELVVAAPGYFESLASLLAATPLETLRDYLHWAAIDATADSLSAPFVAASFELHGRVLRGQRRPEPRWRYCFAATTEAFGAEVGALYAERELSGASRRAARELIDDVVQAFETSLAGLPWIDERTAVRALTKARKISKQIGLPDPRRGEAIQPIDPDRFFESRLAARALAWDLRLAEIGGPVDRDAWRTDPQRAIAYYDPLANAIVVPAGILQPPFFDPDRPAAMNYGALGALVGHELVHAIDDSGRRTDGDGALDDWWEPETAAGFEEATRCVADLYASFEVEPGIHVDGRRTLAENVADLGGLSQALRGYRRWRARHGTPEQLLPGLDDEQLFFVAWAQSWCTLATPEYLRRQVAGDLHAPARFRAIGAASGIPEFRSAFHCERDAPMVAAPLCRVW